MYEVNTREEIDDPRYIDAENPRQAAIDYAKSAVEEGWWEDVAEAGMVYVEVCDEGSESYVSFRVKLDESNMRLTARRFGQ